MFSPMLSREEVLNIARLARLKLTDDEVTLYQGRLGRVLEYMKDLAAVSSDKDAMVKHVPKDALSVREDRAIGFTNQEGLLKNAPSLEEGSFLLPTVVEHE